MKIKHKGLRDLHHRDYELRLPASFLFRLLRFLFMLQEATDPKGVEARGYRLHPSKGTLANHRSVRASGNWRVIFRLEENEAVDVDLVDYH